jgi:hypothetical protein
MTDYPCPSCGYDGPHDWFALNEFECGDCHGEFFRTEQGVPDVDFGPVWVEPITSPALPPYGSPEREAMGGV